MTPAPARFCTTTRLPLRRRGLATGAVLLAAATLTACSDSPDPVEPSPVLSTTAAVTPQPALPETEPPTETAPTVETAPATESVEPPATDDAPRSSVPKRLVGTWDGGSQGATAGRSYSFSREGDVRFRRGNAEVDGTVVVEGDQMTIYLPGMKPWEYSWSISKISVSGYDFSNLQLDGYSYVRQD